MNTAKLSDVIYRLLHHKKERTLFLEGRYDLLAYSEPLIRDLESIDRQQLIAHADQIAKKLLSGNHQGGRGLLPVFPDTITAWQISSGQDPIELMVEFLSSSQFDQYHELPYQGVGLGIEQAFYEYFKENVWLENSPLEGLVRNEFLICLFKSLNHASEPCFYIDPKYVKANSACFYSVQSYQFRLINNALVHQPHFVLYASIKEKMGSKMISGEISPLMADLLFYDNPNPFTHMGEIMRRHQVSLETYYHVCRGLKKLGVLANAA